MDNEKEITYGDVVATMIGCAILGWTMYSLFERSTFLAIIFGLMTIGIVTAYILYNTSIRNTEILERNICKRLDKLGYRHEKQDGTLYVLKNDNRFRIQLIDGFNKRIKHLYVIFDFGDSNFEKVTMDGWTRAANSINLNNSSTTFVTLEKHFCCCYQSAIGNSKDFMNEFEKAYEAIGGAMDDYKKIYPYIERDYPNNTSESKTSIGFK
jgi:hypothetical protein